MTNAIFCDWTKPSCDRSHKIERNGQNCGFTPLFRCFWSVFDVSQHIVGVRSNDVSLIREIGDVSSDIVSLIC